MLLREAAAAGVPGAGVQAGALLGRIRRKLTTEEIVSVEILGGGRSDTRLVTFANGMKAVFKPPGSLSSTEAEVTLSSLAEALGVGQVPPIVEREITWQGRNLGRGSLAYFVSGTQPVFESQVLHQVPPELNALEFLAIARDRHVGNYLRGPGNTMIGIDYSLSFNPASVVRDRVVLGEARPSPEFLTRLRGLDLDASPFLAWLSPAQRDAIKGNRQAILDRYR